MKPILALSLLFCSINAVSQLIKPGQWRGDIHYADVKVPLTFEIGYPSGEIPEITFINGRERRTVANATIEGDSIFIPLDPFDVEIRARYTAMGLNGVYKKYYRDLTLPFTAEFGKPRMAKTSVRSFAPIEKKWDITFSPESSGMSKGVGLFSLRGHIITGTIMTQVSDYRFFEGILDGDSLKLSCFDGAHAFAFIGKRTPEGWAGEMIYDDGYSEPWTAAYSAEVELEDPFEMVQVEPGLETPYYDLLGAGEGKEAIDPSRYEGKVLIIQLFGTWCPNSLDQTKYLVNWYQQNQDREVAILAASYEANYSREYGLERLKEYRELNNISYDMVLGGRLSKTGAAMPFPFMERIEAFPTLVILDKSGYVRYVHSYFNGPATGEYYQAFDQRFNEIIDSLLAE